MSTVTVAEHRRNIAELSRLAALDIGVIMSRHRDAELTRDRLIELLPLLAATYGAAAATLGADWYDDLRDAAAIRGRFRAIPAEPAGPERTDVLARWGVGPLFSAEPDVTTATSNLAGGMQQVIADADRQTVTVSSAEDPAARGWERVIGGGACTYCASLAGAFTSADFKSHTSCGCTAAPIFG